MGFRFEEKDSAIHADNNMVDVPARLDLFMWPFSPSRKILFIDFAGAVDQVKNGEVLRPETMTNSHYPCSAEVS
jgi:hypothetical protein